MHLRYGPYVAFCCEKVGLAPLRQPSSCRASACTREAVGVQFFDLSRAAYRELNASAPEVARVMWLLNVGRHRLLQALS